MDELYLELDEAEESEFTFGPESAGSRLDTAIASGPMHISRSRAQSLIADGAVSLDGNVCADKNHRLTGGENIKILMRLRVPLKLVPEKIDLDIVYEDDELLVINKDKGMVVHPAPGNEHGTLVSALLYHLGNDGEKLPVINGALRPGIVHRIDKNTSGLLVVAKTDRAQRSLSKQLAEHSMKRVYYAIVHGGFQEGEGTISANIDRDMKDRKKWRTSGQDRGKYAVTHYRVVETFSEHSLLEIRLETGRTHQIRVHMSHINRPVLGDDVYGPAKMVKAAIKKGDGHYLHAGKIGFIHPVTREEMEFTVPPPADFEAMLQSLRG